MLNSELLTVILLLCRHALCKSPNFRLIGLRFGNITLPTKHNSARLNSIHNCQEGRNVAAVALPKICMSFLLAEIWLLISLSVLHVWLKP